jgi:hypothetical protein
MDSREIVELRGWICDGEDMTPDDDKRPVRATHDLAKALKVDVGGDALSIIHELRDLMRSVVDAGTSMDTGGGFGSADLNVTIAGIEYHIGVTPVSTIAKRNQAFSAVWEKATEAERDLIRRSRGWTADPQ